ncbi:SDR family NAD(P)-dependent oxidoreductase [Streptomyces sp. NPDC058221]|uniref:SDR family NAD(P)-dependent oxidoreductase n=1 Tax=Streptomyces sp. NPDC058221 TaxID=3346388 RepID=UPI0036EA8CCF
METAPPLRLDVNDRTTLTTATQRAAETLGHLDIAVNNPGYRLIGTAEETTKEQARAQPDTNLLRPLQATQTAPPYPRTQRNSHILQATNLTNLTPLPTLRLHHTAQQTLKTKSKTHTQENATPGIHPTPTEPGPNNTDTSDTPQHTPNQPPPTNPGSATHRASTPTHTPPPDHQHPNPPTHPLQHPHHTHPHPTINTTHRKPLNT